MRKNKLLIAIISLILLVCTAAAFSACKKEEKITPPVEEKLCAFEVTFDLGENESFKTDSSVDTGKVEKPDTPLRDGYTFDGWYETPEFLKKFDFNSPVTSDITIYAKWNKDIKINVLHFEGNGNTDGEMQDIKSEEGQVIRLPLNSFSRTGYKFIGWSDSATGSVKNTDGGWYYTGSLSAVTLFARWEANSYNVILNHCGGESDTENISAVYGSCLPDCVKPIKKGYSFVGYFSEPNGGEEYYDGEMHGVKTYTQTQGLILYAHWVSAPVTVSFNGNGNTNGATKAIETTTDSEIMLPETGYSKTGYKFSGWSLSQSGGELYSENAAYIVPICEGEVVFYAVWTPIVYNIKFDSGNGGEQISSEQVYDSEQKLLPNGFSRRGYTFVCWKILEGDKEIFYGDGQVVENLCSEDGGEVVFYAVWNPVTVNVVFNKLGGIGGSNFVNVTFDAAFPKAVAPSKSGYTFGGYFSEINGHGLKYFDEEMNTVENSDISENNAEIFAFWKPKNNVVLFNANGGEGAQQSVATQTENIITLPKSDFVKTGYAFESWNTLRDGSGESYKANQSFTVPASDSEINLYAIWMPKPITVKFNGNGHTSGTVNSMNGVSDGALSLPKCGFSKNGYNFVGWSLTSDGKDINAENGKINLSATDDGAIEIYAVWELVTYNIKYNLNGGVNSYNNPVEYTYLSGDINLSDPSRNGYDFLGWKEGSEIIPGSTGNKVFTAQWSPTVYTITYVLNGGTNQNNPSTYTIETPTIILNEPVKHNSQFEGWSEGNSIEKGSTGNKVFTALWAGLTFAITYDLDGGQNGEGNPGSYTADSPKIVLKDPIKKGYKFLGWSPNGVIEANSEGDKLFKALWEKEIYNIEYDLKGGINSEYNPSRYSVDDENIFLEDPVKEGYVFDGWLEGMLIEQGSCGDKKFTASWTPITYHIYVIDGLNNDPEDIAYTVESGDITVAVSAKDGAFECSIVCDGYSKTMALDKAGYKMVGWYEGEDDSGCKMTMIIPTGSSGNRFLNGKWVIVTYTITYILDGGTIADVNPESFTVETEEIELAEPEKEGFIFDCWVDENGEIITFIDGQILRDITLTAKWLPITQPDPPVDPDPTEPTVPTEPVESEENQF